MAEQSPERLFQIIRNDKALEDHFFKYLASSSEPGPWLRLVKERGYFNPEKNPTPQEVPGQKGYFAVPYWNALSLLESAASVNERNPSEETTKLVVEIIDAIIGYRNPSGERIENFKTDSCVVDVISEFPKESITAEHIRFIGTVLNSNWGKFISDDLTVVCRRLISKRATERLLQLLDTVLEYKKTAGEYVSVMDKFWLNKLLKDNGISIALLCPLEAAQIAIGRMRRITIEDKASFSPIWIPAIEGSPQRTLHDQYECQLVFFARDMLDHLHEKDLHEQVTQLLHEPHPIFRRIALHAIGRHFQSLRGLLFGCAHNPIDDYSSRHELYQLIRLNSPSFHDDELEEVLEWVESASYVPPASVKEDAEGRSRFLAYYKKRWLSALLATGNPKVGKRYEEYHTVNPEPITNASFDYSIGPVTSIGSISPIQTDELSKKSNAEIADYLATFKQETGWKAPSEEGLSNALKACVSANPRRFAENATTFKEIPRAYQYSLIEGWRAAWRDNREFLWDGVLNFIWDLVSETAFWEEHYAESANNYRNWIISEVSDLIEDGTKDDNHAFDPGLLPAAEKILLTLAAKTPSSVYGLDDVVTLTLNSPQGRLLSALLNCSLRFARLSGEQQDARWRLSIKSEFDRRIDLGRSLEFSVILGEYLPNFLYLDEAWVRENINRIFPNDNDQHWEAAFTGYLVYANTLYRNIYFLAKDNSHYSRALKRSLVDRDAMTRAIQHVCIGYLDELEELKDEDSLIRELLATGESDHLLKVVELFSMLRDKSDVKLQERLRLRLRPLWKAVFDLVSRNEEQPEYRRIASHLGSWLALLDVIDDEVLPWLRLSAKYIEVDSNSFFFIECLADHVGKTPDRVAGIFEGILEAEQYPDYPKEKIEEIVRTLYEQAQKTSANRIANLYLSKGFDFLRPLFNEYNA